MSDILEDAVRNLLTQWLWVRRVPAQALEAVRAAAQITLSNDAAAAAAAYVEELFQEQRRPGAADVRRTDESINVETILRMILAGEIEVRRRKPGAAAAWPPTDDEFLFRGTEILFSRPPRKG